MAKDKNIPENIKDMDNENHKKDATDTVKQPEAVKEVIQEKEGKEKKSKKVPAVESVKSEAAATPIEPEVAGATDKAGKKSNKRLLKTLRILFSLGFLVFLALFLNEVALQPFLAKQASSKAKDLYEMATPTPYAETAPPTQAPVEAIDTASVDKEYAPTPTPDPTKDEMGRLLEFKDLLNENQDVKGWIKIDNLTGENDTKINYVVVQSSNGDPEYYLTRDWLGNKVKAGSLFLDYKSSVESNTPNLVIHGHNMTSTDDMFHYLLRFNEKEYYDSHPIIDFNTIYQTGQWKIFSVFITNGSSVKEPFFDYTQSKFKDSSEFLNFVYQLRIRSIFDAEDIDINENDQLLTLSTCSYEVKDYRTVIVARRVREGEDPTVNTDNVTINPEPLYPESFYYRYGGKAPELPATFEDALEADLINWYQPVKE